MAVPNRFAAIPARSRSKISNGSWRLQNVDGRSSIGRRYRDLCQAYAAQIGGELTVLNRELVETAAGLAMRSALIRSAIARGELTEDDQVRVSSELRRVQAMIAARAEQNKPVPLSPVDAWRAQHAVAADVDDDIEES